MAEPLVHRVVTVMFDWECWAIWVSDANGYQNVAPRAFGLSVDLALALEAWTSEAQATFVAHDPLASGVRDPATHRAWIGRGRALAWRLQRELGGSTTVEYDDEVAGARGRIGAPPADE